MKIPSKTKCYQLICDMGMMDHIVAHSIQVCQVATLLTDHLGDQGICLNRGMVRTSALLHDITKTRSFETGEDHARTGEQLLVRLGYAEVGHIIGQHVRLNRYVRTGSPTETEIVNYADKRVLHDQVVPLQERLDYILEKYGKDAEILKRIHHTWQKTTELEDKIFRNMSFPPQYISDFLTPEDFSGEISAYQDFKQNNGAALLPEGSVLLSGG